MECKVRFRMCFERDRGGCERPTLSRNNASVRWGIEIKSLENMWRRSTKFSQFIGSTCKDSLFAAKIMDIGQLERQPSVLSKPNNGLPLWRIASSRKCGGKFSWRGTKHTKRVGRFVTSDSASTSNNPWVLTLSLGPWNKKTLEPWCIVGVVQSLAPKTTSIAPKELQSSKRGEKWRESVKPCVWRENSWTKTLIRSWRGRQVEKGDVLQPSSTETRLPRKLRVEMNCLCWLAFQNPFVRMSRREEGILSRQSLSRAADFHLSRSACSRDIKGISL